MRRRQRRPYRCPRTPTADDWLRHLPPISWRIAALDCECPALPWRWNSGRLQIARSRQHHKLRGIVRPAIPVQAPTERLLDIALRLNACRGLAALQVAIVAETTALLGARRTLLVSYPDAVPSAVLGSQLPAGESADALLEKVMPWLAEARDTHSARLRHGPEGAAVPQQRSCLVVPLLVERRPLGLLYADIEGRFGRFEATECDLLVRQAVELPAQTTVRQLDTQEALERQTATTDVLHHQCLAGRSWPGFRCHRQERDAPVRGGRRRPVAGHG